MAIIGKFLTVLLFANVGDEGDQRVDAPVEFLEVGVKIRLIDVTVAILDVVEEVLNFDAIETFDRIIEFGVVDVLDGFRGQVDGKTTDVEHGLPVLLGLLVGCS